MTIFSRCFTADVLGAVTSTVDGSEVLAGVRREELRGMSMSGSMFWFRAGVHGGVLIDVNVNCILFWVPVLVVSITVGWFVLNGVKGVTPGGGFSCGCWVILASFRRGKGFRDF